MPGAGQLSTNVRPLSISVGLSSFSVNLSTISVGPSSISVGVSSISVGSLSISFTLLSISVRLLCISVRLWNTSVSFQLSVLGFQLSVLFYDDNSGMRKAFFIWVLGNQNCHQCNDNSCLSVHEDIQHVDAGETSGRKAQFETGHSEVRELHLSCVDSCVNIHTFWQSATKRFAVAMRYSTRCRFWQSVRWWSRWHSWWHKPHRLLHSQSSKIHYTTWQ